MLCLERKRTERSRRKFVLLLLSSEGLLKQSGKNSLFETMARTLVNSTRETDITGWYKTETTIGVIFTEIGAEADGRQVASALLTKVTNALSTAVSIEQIGRIAISVHVYPEDWTQDGDETPADRALYPDRLSRLSPGSGARLVKRLMDIAGSLAAIVLLSPLFLAIAVAIKATSKGPVLFRQKRLGYCGQAFQFLKFRSMYTEQPETIHQEYIRDFIQGRAAATHAAGRTAVYKLTADARITPIGRILRKTSLDELPQFFNVLAGEMSLVGPRPPIGYEVAHYDIWHKDRLLSARPGITGLWQVRGRSTVSFDEMVRLDLRYARTWSIWLDIRILLQTPKAVISGTGAY
jgi:lipopolysaccharide/colanic/teichoic acid biosynthesis glycosyltransferase